MLKSRGWTRIVVVAGGLLAIAGLFAGGNAVGQTRSSTTATHHAKKPVAKGEGSRRLLLVRVRRAGELLPVKGLRWLRGNLRRRRFG